MINMISERTGTTVRVGQNGVVVVDGPPEGIVKAAKAINMVQEEAHAADLMGKIEAYLGGGEQVGN